MITRRRFVATLGAASLGILAACHGVTNPLAREPSRLTLTQRPRTRTATPGTDVLTNASLRRAYLQVPPDYVPTTPFPLVIAFHGAGGRGDDFLGQYSSITDAHGFVLLAPNSFEGTWDAINDDGKFGADVLFINDIIAQVYDRCSIDINRIGLIGFSDGASYAISLGLANGDQVRSVAAHSPGYVIDAPHHGHPDVFISHGTLDTILPIDQTSRKIVPALRALGDDVTFVEFDGRHEVPVVVASNAMNWMESRFNVPVTS